MADTPEPSSGGSGQFGFLTRKIGPMPVWLWGVLIVGAYYWYTHYGPGASSASGTGKAVNTGDSNADVDSQGTNVQKISGSRYGSNAEWEAAAINYLVGESVPPDEASAAIFKYLHSDSLTPQERQDVNLAIEGIGPPPKIPPPAEQQKPPPHTHPIGKPPIGKGKGPHLPHEPPPEHEPPPPHHRFPHEPPPPHNPPPTNGKPPIGGGSGGPPHHANPGGGSGGPPPHHRIHRPTPRKRAA